MRKQQGRPGSGSAVRSTPIRHGSPLYRLLRMIAQEIAQDLEGRSCGVVRRSTEREGSFYSDGAEAGSEGLNVGGGPTGIE